MKTYTVYPKRLGHAVYWRVEVCDANDELIASDYFSKDEYNEDGAIFEMAARIGQIEFTYDCYLEDEE